MISNAEKLHVILQRIENVPTPERYTHYSALQDVILAMQKAGEKVPTFAKDLAEDLLSEAVEARFDNMPV